jgi:glycosyltransferase involved in cell wall biosynthesis
MKILVFCSDVIPRAGLPTSGGGLRSWQLVETCRALGHQVIISVPLFTYFGRQHASTLPEELRQNSWTIENQDMLIHRHRPDAVLFCSSWMVDRLGARHDCLHLYDLSGAQLLEMAYKGQLDEPAFRVKVEKLAKADFVFCGGHIQRTYFLPFLLMAGHAADELTLPVVPLAFVGTPPARTLPETFELLAGGGFYPWQDHSLGLRAAARFVARQPKGTARLRVYGGSHGIHCTEENTFRALRAELSTLPNVEFHDFVSNDEWGKIQASASLAVDVQARNPERELAVTTRTLDYLWNGLPVLHHDYAELSQLIARHDAGWVVDPHDERSIASALAEAAADRARLAERSDNARRLAEEKFSYSKVWGPLAAYLANPRKRIARLPCTIIGQREYHQLLADSAQWQASQHSRAFRAARALSKLRRSWRKSTESPS